MRVAKGFRICVSKITGNIDLLFSLSCLSGFGTREMLAFVESWKIFPLLQFLGRVCLGFVIPLSLNVDRIP
jgi:hypothetical protein